MLVVLPLYIVDKKRNIDNYLMFVKGDRKSASQINSVSRLANQVFFDVGVEMPCRDS